MLLYSETLTRADLEQVASEMPIVLWEADADFHGARRRRIKLLIRPTALGTDGDRWRKLTHNPWSGTERRIWACSWHAHYVFMAAVLELDPNAEFKTALAHWKGREDFHARAPMTANLNWGSMMYPNYAGEMASYTPSVTEMREIACEIAGTEYTEDRDITFGELYSDNPRLVNVRTIKQSTIATCPHVIFVANHYKADGSCKCYERGENIMAEWGYVWSDQLGRWANDDE